MKHVVGEVESLGGHVKDLAGDGVLASWWEFGKSSANFADLVVNR